MSGMSFPEVSPDGDVEGRSSIGPSSWRTTEVPADAGQPVAHPASRCLTVKASISRRSGDAVLSPIFHLLLSVADNKMVIALTNCEPEPLVSSGLHSMPLSPKGIHMMSDLVDRELVATISWAKQIPGFTDLILNDQMRLLQTTWGEILSLSLAFRLVATLPHEELVSLSPGADLSNTRINRHKESYLTS